MNTHRIQFCCIAAFFVTALLSSCVKESQPDRQTVPDGEPVEVSLDLTAAPLVGMTLTGTKGTAINDTTNPEVNDIKNLWILQFDGTGDDAKRRGNPIYIENYNPSERLKLIASSVENRLVFVANTFATTVAFGDCHTLADAKAIIRSVNFESDVVRTETVGDTLKHYPVLNGHSDCVVGFGSVSATLTHSVARIDVKVVNAIPDSLTIESVTMKSVPDRFNYITDYDLPELYPDAATMNTIDYAPTPWADGGIDGGDANRRNFSFYVPANKRGTTTEDTNGGKYKGFFAPDKASYAFIQAYYYEGTGASAVKRSVSYSFYLGADLTNDYNIKPNGHYSYTFTINKKGNEDYDGRVEDTGTVDFRKRELANCYIINPPEAEGIWRNYQIPVKRVYDFWRKDGKYEDNDDYALLSTSNGWVVDVIWSEFPIDSTHFKWVKKNRIQAEGLDPDNDYFEFSVKSGVSGNCVVGIRRYSNSALLIDDIYLWSWHLWVTDYKPDKASAYTINPAEGRYVYKVPGGDVHRYNNDFFNTGIYAGKVIMDRNLGAKDIYYHDSNDNYDGCLYYQFGRKDPFSGPRKIYIRHDHDENPSTYDYETWSTATYTIQNTAADANCRNMPYSIKNPLTFIMGGYWTYNDKYNPTTYDGNIRWQDPEVKTDAGKSIFDPCPPGWKVPKNGTWSGFNIANYFLWNDPLSPGRNYFPNGSSDRSTGTIFYPASGYLYYGSGAFNYVGSGGYCWSCSPYNASYAYYLYFNSGRVNSSNSNSRAYGFTVRCVQE